MITDNIIGQSLSAEGSKSFQAINPISQQKLPGIFVEATTLEVDQAVEKAGEAWQSYHVLPGARRAEFLRAIAEEIETLGDDLINRYVEESGLPEGRAKGERGRTIGQLRLFADVIEEGSWVEATIDHDPDKGIPHLANYLTAIGPVVVFTASNFPLAFSTAGGDTAAALAAGCPVIVKAHESHPGVNAFVSEAISKAAQRTGMPDGVFSSLNAVDYAVGTQLVQHPGIKAVAFTGSMRGGLALHKIASERDEPIPVFAEMGSINPVFIQPGIVQADPEKLAGDIAASVNLGAGQFCTNPGLLVLRQDHNTERFLEDLKNAFKNLVPSTMLNRGIYQNFEKGKLHFISSAEVETQYQHEGNGEWKGYPALASVEASAFLQNPNMQEEVFGPFSMLVICRDDKEMLAVAKTLKGQLSAVIMGDDEDLSSVSSLAEALRNKVGRLIFNGMPTGVAVCHAMQHGGPFPATTDARFTSVGTKAIRRFVRPVVYQGAPDSLLPEPLQKNNPLGIWRLVNGAWTNS